MAAAVRGFDDVFLLSCLNHHVSIVRVRRGADWVTAAGWATLALLLSTTWLLPWYGAWLMPLAGLSDSPWLRRAALAFTAAYLATKILPGLR